MMVNPATILHEQIFHSQVFESKYIDVLFVGVEPSDIDLVVMWLLSLVHL